MSLFQIFKRKVETITNHDDFQIYGEICAEIEQGKRDLGVWGKAYSQVGGDEAKAKAKYIELMVALRKEEIEKRQLKLQSQIKDLQNRIKKTEALIQASTSAKQWFYLLLTIAVGLAVMALLSASTMEGRLFGTFLGVFFIAVSFSGISSSSRQISQHLDHQKELRDLVEELTE